MPQGTKPFYPPEPPVFNAVQAFLIARAEVEYWTELERLTREGSDASEGGLIA